MWLKFRAMIASHRMSFMLNDVELGIIDPPANDASGEIVPSHPPSRLSSPTHFYPPEGRLLFSTEEPSPVQYSI
jgi:hypothetical protein